MRLQPALTETMLEWRPTPPMASHMQRGRGTPSPLSTLPTTTPPQRQASQPRRCGRGTGAETRSRCCGASTTTSTRAREQQGPCAARPRSPPEPCPPHQSWPTAYSQPHPSHYPGLEVFLPLPISASLSCHQSKSQSLSKCQILGNFGPNNIAGNDCRCEATCPPATSTPPQTTG